MRTEPNEQTKSGGKKHEEKKEEKKHEEKKKKEKKKEVRAEQQPESQNHRKAEKPFKEGSWCFDSKVGLLLLCCLMSSDVG